METPPVDVVIAARNEARTLGRCLEAVRRQQYPAGHIAVYVVDNGSRDMTEHVAARYGAQVLTEPRPGAAAARNRGIRAGRGELIALLDAHCVPGERWVSLMARRFADARLGGCQGRIESRAIDPRVRRYLERSGALANDRVLEDAVSGKRNIYPWILSGNAMYRRRAIEEAGLFDAALPACEDVDLAWRVFLLGYQLGYEPAAEVIHYDQSPWPAFIRKGLRYGAAAARIAHAYRDHGAGNKFAPRQLWGSSLAQTVIGLYYWLGYTWQALKLRAGLGCPLAPRTVQPVRDGFRPLFHWDPGLAMRISPDAVYWFRDHEHTSVIVHVPTRTRLVLDAVGDFIWRAIADCMPRDRIIAAIGDRYNVSARTAGADLDEFVEELVGSGVLSLKQQR